MSLGLAGDHHRFVHETEQMLINKQKMATHLGFFTTEWESFDVRESLLLEESLENLRTLYFDQVSPRAKDIFIFQLKVRAVSNCVTSLRRVRFNVI